MNNIIRILILAVIGGLIGYITNVIAIKLIFRPINPIKIPILNIEIIGMIPKRKTEIATNIAKVVEEQFISVDEITDNIITEQDKQHIIDYIKVRVKLILSEKMTLIPSTIRNLVQNYVSEIIEDEIREGIDELSEEMIIKTKNRINIKEIIENNKLDAVISMPSGVFKPYAGVSTAILIFTKTGSGGTDKVWFYDMKADGYSLDDKRQEVSENDIPDIIDRFKNLEGETERERTEQSFMVDFDKIKANGYDLSINKYKEIVYEPVEYEPTDVIFGKIEKIESEIQKEMSELKKLLEL